MNLISHHHYSSIPAPILLKAGVRILRLYMLPRVSGLSSGIFATPRFSLKIILNPIHHGSQEKQ